VCSVLVQKQHVDNDSVLAKKSKVNYGGATWIDEISSCSALFFFFFLVRLVRLTSRFGFGTNHVMRRKQVRRKSSAKTLEVCLLPVSSIHDNVCCIRAFDGHRCSNQRPIGQKGRDNDACAE
jgi:hypothetical protein